MPTVHIDKTLRLFLPEFAETLHVELQSGDYEPQPFRASRRRGLKKINALLNSSSGNAPPQQQKDPAVLRNTDSMFDDGDDSLTDQYKAYQHQQQQLEYG